MQAIFDHLGAIVVGFAVLLLLMLTQARSQGESMEAVEFAAARSTGGAFLEVLEQDLLNVGAGVDAASPRVHALEGGAPTLAFEFSGAVAPAGDAPVERIRYEALPAGTVTIGRAAVPVYQLVRLQVIPGGSVVTVRSVATVTEFAVTLLDAAGRPVGADLDAAREVVVHFAAAPPTGRGGPLTVMRWHRSLRLQHLAGA